MNVQDFIDDRGLSGVIELALSDLVKRFPESPIHMDLSVDPECGDTSVVIRVFMDGTARDIVDQLHDFDENGPPSVVHCSELLVMPMFGRGG